jgi:uncharacterized protein YjbI with pentapeptide repeats
MVRAARALVRPRFVSPATKASLPLDDEVQLWLDQGRPGWLQITGGPGSGKSTALAHLAAVFASHADLCILDDGERLKAASKSTAEPLMLFAGSQTPTPAAVRKLTLAPWTRDELLEYLLAAHPNECAAVLARVSRTDETDFSGVPRLWRLALDELAGDASLRGPVPAVLRYVQRGVPSAELYSQVERACLDSELKDGGGLPVSLIPNAGGLPKDVVHLLRHAPVRRALATERLVAQLQIRHVNYELGKHLPHSLVEAVGARIAGHTEALAHLTLAMRRPTEQAMAVSLLVAANRAWMPSTKDCLLYLDGAYLGGAKWPGIRLRGVGLRGADLSQADLGWAKMDDADASEASLVLAHLPQASLKRFKARKADLGGADLSSVRATKANFSLADLSQATFKNAVLVDADFIQADLRLANFQGAQLVRAGFCEAQLGETDFTAANLTDASLTGVNLRTCKLQGATLEGAKLMRSDLEGMCLDGLNFVNAKFDGAVLTGSSMVRGDLTGASLRNTGLADVDWPGTCLRGVDFQQATFHMGSSRSGLVNSTIASEGSRTGFYTDDYNEQDFKSPEEIRKANLRFCDLRGALVESVDFYLVDLRGARYDTRQAEHFRRCGAILEDRCSA